MIHNDTDGVGEHAALLFKVDSQNEAGGARSRTKAGIFFVRDDPGTRGTGKLHIAVEGANDDTNVAPGDAAITIDTARKVLIGNSTSQTTDLLQIETPASGGGHGIAIRRNDNNTDQEIGHIMFGNVVDSDIGEIKVKTDGATNTGAMIFSVATAGTTNDRLVIFNNARQVVNLSATASGHGNFVGEVGASSKALMFEHTVGGGECGKIITTSNTAVLSNTSDYRLKENVDYTWDATTRLKQLKPARFNWINDETNTLVDGFIAHEVSSIVPTAVYGEKDGVDEHGNPDWQGIAVTELVPLLVKTIQELEARITALEG